MLELPHRALDVPGREGVDEERALEAAPVDHVRRFGVVDPMRGDPDGPKTPDPDADRIGLPDSRELSPAPDGPAPACRQAPLASVRLEIAAGVSPGIDADGDNGGPLFSKGADGRFILVGLTSWGEGCGQTDKGLFGIYTRVSRYNAWVQQNTK